MRVGGLGLGGLTLPSLLKARAEAGTTGESDRPGKAKSVIFLFFGGGLPQHEMWDPKPDGPKETRGDFGAISTRTPGLLVGELMPQVAMLTDKFSVLRGMVTGDNSHSSSGYQMLTGVPHIPLSQENATPKKPNDSPSMGGILRALTPRTANGLPPAITLPKRLANVGDAVWPGQDAGFLGRRHDPWLVTCDPSAANFSVPDCALPKELPALRLDRRLSLLEQFDKHSEEIRRTSAARNYDMYSRQAIDLVAGGKARDAFDLTKEKESTRDRYGRSQWAQSVLLTRRLVEAGVPYIHVNWCLIEGKENYGSWDTHAKHSKCLKEFLMPMFDQAVSALITELSERGLLEETLVCVATEFGHTPRINGNGGRDHWGQVFSIALAGGGIRGGVVHGASDQNAAYPISGRTEACDFIATVFHCLGHSAETMVHDMEGRPIPISRGHVINAIV